MSCLLEYHQVVTLYTWHQINSYCLHSTLIVVVQGYQCDEKVDVYFLKRKNKEQYGKKKQKQG